jgi:tetratricopeptide (TPR) repeat protein/TolB-like protein/predicted Ser/Thr protein kinase
MICPQCGTQNPPGTSACVECSLDFSQSVGGETLQGASTPPLSGETLQGVVTPPTFESEVDFGPRYRIEALLGQGGMGKVYKAYDKELGRTVALKMVRIELTSSTDTMQRFKQELLLASKITHKNILRIHDLGEAGGVKFISMAYVEGTDLHHILKKEHRLPLPRLLRIAVQLCEALEAARLEGVVHRDLKPQNVLIGKDDQVYVTDFGIAKSLESDNAGMTRTGMFLGTPQYMAPEQVEGKPVDNRSDLYALGLILYEMSTGDLPFAGDSAPQIMLLRLRENPKNPKLANPELPDWFDAVVMRCLAREPEQRYQTARELQNDLEAAHTTAGPLPTGTLSGRTVQITLPVLTRGHKRAALGAGAVVVILAVLLAVPVLRHRVLHIGAASRPSNDKFVAIMPFRVLSDQADLGYVAEGLADGLSAKLFQAQSVHLASASAVERATKTEVSHEGIGHALGVTLLVQGSVQAAADKIRVVMQLEDVSRERHMLWTQEFTGVPQDLLVLEDQIYDKLTTALGLKLSTEERARAGAHPTENIEAYDLYLRGRAVLHTGRDVKDAQSAITLYLHALEKDQEFALAYAGLADAYMQLYARERDTAWAQKALSAAQQSRSLNDNLPEAHYALGTVLNATGKNFEAAVEVKHALDLEPNSDEGYRRLGAIYADGGRQPEAVEAYQKAIEINPYYWLNYYELGRAERKFGHYDKALAAFQKVVQLDPKNATAYNNLGIVYFSQGNYDLAIPQFQKSISLLPSYGTYSNLGTIYYYQKRYDDAVKMFEKAVEMNPNSQLYMGNLADAYRWSSQKDKAAATYDKAIALAVKELQVNPRNAITMGYLAQYYAKKGDTATALQTARRARSIDSGNVDLIWAEGIVQTLAGHTDAAIQTLRAAFEKGYATKQAENEPELDSLRNNAEFQKLMTEFAPKSK